VGTLRQALYEREKENPSPRFFAALRMTESKIPLNPPFSKWETGKGARYNLSSCVPLFAGREGNGI
jgi:hypothetical protein